MPNFKQADIKNESESKTQNRIVKLDGEKERTATEYEPRKLLEKGDGEYSTTKAKYGPLAATDPERVLRAQRDRGFSLNPLLRNPLAVEEEETRAIEARVQARIKELSEAAIQKAHSEGYEAGRQQGYDESFAKFKEEGHVRLARLETMIDQAERAKEEIFRANERFLMSMIFRIARTVLLRELTTDKDYILRLTKELIERVGVRENVRIRLHPAELATLTTLKADIEAQFGALKNLHIETSNQVHQGGCIVETEWNAIDASIETQLKALETALLGASGS